MPLYRLTENLSKQKTKELLIENVILASSFSKRLFGLILEPRLDAHTCFFIDHCSSIHTVGMRYSLDVIFLGRKGKIIKIFEKIPPFRFTPFIKNAKKAIELYPGTIRTKKIRLQEHIVIE
jgi:uncharacterized protein